MAGGGEGVGYIIRALVANFLIACAKGVGAFITGSGAMLAETLHSLSDCINQVLLLLGVRQGRKPADAEHPRPQAAAPRAGRGRHDRSTSSSAGSRRSCPR